jgi:hypothetical protein
MWEVASLNVLGVVLQVAVKEDINSGSGHTQTLRAEKLVRGLAGIYIRTK